VNHELHLLVNIAIATVVALIGGLIAHRLRQSVIVGYLVAGVAIGPFTPGFIGDREQIASLAEVGVIFLMFALGIEFSLKELARVKGVALTGTVIQVLLTVGAGAALGHFLGWPRARGLFIGGIIAISSTMVVLKALLDRGEVASTHGRALLGLLIAQDLAAVVLIVLLPKLADGGDAAIELFLTLLRAVAFIGVALFLGVRVVPPLMARVEQLGSPELFLLTAVALALGTSALGAFIGGLVLTETEFDHRVIAEVVPMRNLFATLFFVSVGTLIDPAFIARNLPAVLDLVLFIVVVKVLSTFVATLPFRLGAKTTTFVSLGLLQIGEFSYVLARAGRESGAITADRNSLVLTASMVTIVLTPGTFGIAPRVATVLGRPPSTRPAFAARATLIGEEAVLHDTRSSSPILARVARFDQGNVSRAVGVTATIAPERAGAVLLLEERARILVFPSRRRSMRGVRCARTTPRQRGGTMGSRSYPVRVACTPTRGVDARAERESRR